MTLFIPEAQTLLTVVQTTFFGNLASIAATLAGFYPIAAERTFPHITSSTCFGFNLIY